MRVQHGDVVLEAVQTDGLSWKTAKKGFVVEKGEGVHTHTMIDDCEVAEKDGVLYLKAIPGIAFGINHAEHGVETLNPEKIYRKGIELEYNAETDEARKTQD